MTIQNYILEGKKPKPVDNVIVWAKWYQGANRTVRKSKIRDVNVSTVFLGIDHSFGEGPPILFETMVFGGEYHEYQRRYSTWDEAENGHLETCKMILS